MSTFETAADVAASFTKHYYTLLTQGDVASLNRLYGETSCINFVALNSATPQSYKGKEQILAYLSNVQQSLGPQKIAVRNVDFVSADTSVAVTCSGHVYTRMMRRVFSQSFVLAPTPYRNNGTFFIVGESLRFLNEEADVIPEGALESSELDALIAARAVEEAEEQNGAQAAPTSSRPKRTRPDRKERKQDAAPAAVEQPEPVAAVPEKKDRQRPERSKRPERAAKTEEKDLPKAGKPEQKERERKLTSFVKILNVPEEVQLSAVVAEAEKKGTVKDKYWVEDAHCVIEFENPASARTLVRLSGKYLISGKGPFTVEYFFV